MEPHGGFSPEMFKGLFVGCPLGLFPYFVGPLVEASNDEAVVEAITKSGYQRSE
jgi:hypothetical protein